MSFDFEVKPDSGGERYPPPYGICAVRIVSARIDVRAPELDDVPRVDLMCAGIDINNFIRAVFFVVRAVTDQVSLGIWILTFFYRISI